MEARNNIRYAWTYGVDVYMRSISDFDSSCGGIMRKNMNNIVMEMYKELFKAAKPSADFEKMIKSGEASKPDWFMRYYLPMDKQQAIINKIAKKHKLNEMEKRGLSIEACLGSSPNSSIETWIEVRKHDSD